MSTTTTTSTMRKLDDEFANISLGVGVGGGNTTIKAPKRYDGSKHDQLADEIKGTTLTTTTTSRSDLLTNPVGQQPVSQFFAPGSNVITGGGVSRVAVGPANTNNKSSNISSSSSTSSTSSSSSSPPMNYFATTTNNTTNNSHSSSSSSAMVHLNHHGAKSTAGVNNNGNYSSGDDSSSDDALGSIHFSKGLSGLKNLGNTVIISVYDRF